MSPALAIVLAAYIVSPTDAVSAGIQKPHYSATPMPYEPPPPAANPFVLMYSLGMIGPFPNASYCEFWGKAALKPGVTWSCWQQPFQRRQFCGYNLQLASGQRVNSYSTEKDCEAALSYMNAGKCLMEECPVS
jgi:hypothetical protein